MANIADIKSGAIFEVPLHKGFGFGYIKLIYSRDISKISQDQLFAKSYDLFSDKPVEIFDKVFFESDKLLFFPWFSMGFPPLRGAHKWKLLGHADLTKEDKVFPDYIDHVYNGQTLEQRAQGEYGISFRRNFQNMRLHSKSVDNVKHLGYGTHYSATAMVQILTLHRANMNGKTYTDVYSPEEIKKDSFIKHNWNSLLSEMGDVNAHPKITRMRALK